MRRRVAEVLGAAFLVAAAAAVAIPFRESAMAALRWESLGWDAAHHATVGLDLFDDLARLRLGGALATFFSQHWWSPFFGAVLTPFYALFGRNVSSASLPSFTAFVLTPAAAWLAARRLSGDRGLLESGAGLVLVAVFLLDAPLVVEMSSWPMFESLGGLLALVAWFFFAGRERPGALRAACAFGAALWFLKYHYGVFLLPVFAVVLWRETSPVRAGAKTSLAALLPPRLVAPAFLGAVVLAGVRLALQVRDPHTRFPSVPNVAYALLLFVVLQVVFRWRRAAAAWRALPGPLRIFGTWAVLPIVIWCLIPGNVRAWYNETFLTPPAARARPWEQLAAFGGFLRDEYTSSPIALAVLTAGLVLALAVPGEGAPARRAMACFVLWPVGLMAMSPFPVEARFLGCLLPSVCALSVASLLVVLGRLRPGVRAAAVAVTCAAVLVPAVAGRTAFSRELKLRAPYRYGYAPEDAAFALALEGALHGQSPIFVNTAGMPAVGPTLRLGLRLAHPALAPGDVEVESLSIPRLAGDVRDAGPGPAQVAVEESLSAELEASPGLVVVGRRAGPLVPGGAGRVVVYDVGVK
jgi:hypothetical protein